MAVVSAASVLTPITAEASSNYSMRKKVVVAAGIMRETSDDSAPVTRAQFAEMLVKASTLRSSVSGTTMFRFLQMWTGTASMPPISE